MTESKALEDLSRMGFKVEIVAYRYSLEATAYIVRRKGAKDLRRPSYEDERFAGVAGYPFQEDGIHAEGYGTLMRRLLEAVEAKLQRRRQKLAAGCPSDTVVE